MMPHLQLGDIEDLPASGEVACDAVEPAVVMTATDDCGDPVAVIFSEVASNQQCSGTYTLTRTWIAMDCSGNAITYAQTLNVVDNVAPVFTLIPSDETGTCSEPSYAYDAEDECGTVTFEETRITLLSDDCGNYVDEITATATDECGNSASIQFLRGVSDNESPHLHRGSPSGCNHLMQLHS